MACNVTFLQDFHNNNNKKSANEPIKIRMTRRVKTNRVLASAFISLVILLPGLESLVAEVLVVDLVGDVLQVL